MNILHILDAVNRGGSEILALDFCRAASRYRANVFFAVTHGGELEDELSQSGVKYFRLQRNWPVDLKVVSQLRSILKENDIRIVHSHQPVEGLHAYLAASAINVKQVLTIHGHFLSTKNRITGRFLIPRMDANIAVSQGFLQEFRKRMGFRRIGNFHVLHNGIDETKLTPTGKNLRHELGLPADTMLMGMVANFNQSKDQLTICKALPRIFQAYQNSRFVFVGKRDQKPPFAYDRCVEFCRQNGIMDKVHFVGSRDDIAEILSSLDLFVFSSLEDSFGLAVVEAMMVGIPVIAADIPAMLEVTRNGEFATLFKTRDEQDLSDKIIALLNDGNKRKMLSQAAQKWAVEQFNIDAYVRNLMRLYARLLENSKEATAEWHRNVNRQNKQLQEV